MNKKPFFSVIVPEHNSAEYMRKGLESIRSQAFADYELIIICDKCNTKAEMEIAYEYRLLKERELIQHSFSL